MKLLFVFTGGTIGSTVQGEYIGIDREKPYVLLERYRTEFGMDFTYDTVAPYTALSENSTGDTLRLLCESVKKGQEGEYDGIIVTHGTDTLAYAAAALSYTLAPKIPVLLVSSNVTLEDSRANGLANLWGAVRFIREVGTPGVFVAYRNAGEDVKIHRGTRLLESPAFSDRVESVGGEVGAMREGVPFLKSSAYRERADELPILSPRALNSGCPHIARIEPYPGNVYPSLSSEVRYVLHGTYHSGTVNTRSSLATAWFSALKAQGVSVFLTGVTKGASYESTKAFEALSLQPLFNMAPVAAFVKLWLLIENYPERKITAEMLQKSLSGDVVPV